MKKKWFYIDKIKSPTLGHIVLCSFLALLKCLGEFGFGMYSQCTEAYQVSDKYRILSAEDIVRIKDGKKTCPKCMLGMRYKKTSGNMKEWSPSKFAWICVKCNVFFLDGSINPSDKTWEKRIEERDKDRVSKYLSFLFSFKKSGPE